ncbi:methionyl-tRNA formyltransferase [Candidatus Daviesbacteria bacterium]|nr:methionyl-tRNA formyltransferase [Candidatus Daviesbacteria bacterium]
MTTSTQSPVALVAKKNGLPILEPKQLDVNFIKSHLSFLDADLYIVVAYGRILPRLLLDIPKFGSINIHPSKLPLYRGPSPIQAQILDGITDSAISFILMDEEMDHGPILYQEPYQILETDTFESLCQKMFAKSAEILPNVINDLSKGKITPRLQNHAIAEYCNLVKKQDGYFDLPVGRQVLNLQKLDRMVRAYYPWPGTWTKWNGKIVKLFPEGKIQMEGKNVTDLKSFLNGYPDFPLA